MYEEVIKKLEATPHVLKAKLIGAGKERILLAPYKCKVIFSGGETGVFGYGSLSYSRCVLPFCDNDSEYAIKVGNFCDNSKNTTILLGGEHANNKVVNYSFAGFLDAIILARNTGMKLDEKLSYSRGPVEIGSNVILSVGASILSGVKIGNGAVIGSGAVVTKDVPPFAIVGGNPAKIIKYRFDEKTIEAVEKIRWWDMHIIHILENMDAINSLPEPKSLEKLQSLGEAAYRKEDNNYLVFDAVPKDDGGILLNFHGAETAGELIKYDDLPLDFKFFLSQLGNPPDSLFYLIKDIFKFCGMTS